jgi:ketosteroid isomerase-like protein
VKNLWMIAVALAGACGNHHDKPPAPMTGSGAVDLGATFAACWTAWSAGDIAKLTPCYAKDAVTESPGAGFPPATQIAAVLEAAKQLKTAFPDLAGTPQLVLVNDRKVAAVVRLSGTHETKKKPIGLLGGVIDDFDATGAITHESDYFDALTIQGQLDPTPSHPVRAWDASTSLVKQTVTAKHDATEQANVEVVKQLIAAFNKHDFAAFGALVPDDATWADAAEQKDWTKAELIADRTAAAQGFPDIQITTQDVWGAGDFVVEVAELAGTNAGPMPGIAAPTHKKIAVPYLAIHQVVTGKVAHTWVFDQGAAFLTQLGLK